MAGKHKDNNKGKGKDSKSMTKREERRLQPNKPAPKKTEGKVIDWIGTDQPSDVDERYREGLEKGAMKAAAEASLRPDSVFTKHLLIVERCTQHQELRYKVRLSP